MKKKMLLGLFTILVLGLGVVAFAFTTGVTADKTAISCCKGDSCPMKKKDSAGKDAASCCDNCDCCKDGSCPMKKKDGSGTHTDHATMSDHSKMDAASADASSCDCDCCKAKDAKKDG